uniref:Uncharacterized protein n=1 Tax=Cannabis sativa TaxID=3483 RepID=A0A803PGW3_CANSA
MLIKLAKLFGLYWKSNRKKETRKLPLLIKDCEEKKEEENSMPVPLSFKDIFVRIVHPGGREEWYPSALTAFQLLEKYPGKCVARPEVFKNPHESLLWPQEKLLPGQKYLIIPTSTVQKLMRKHPEKLKGRGDDEEMRDVKITDSGGTNFDESASSAKELYASKEKLSRNLLVKGIRKRKPFVPPLPKSRAYRGPMWEPSLTSVQELSP